jgi:hypothetical protein
MQAQHVNSKITAKAIESGTILPSKVGKINIAQDGLKTTEHAHTHE